MSDEIINFYKKAKDSDEPQNIIDEQKKTVVTPLKPNEPFERFLFELAEKLQKEKVITEKQQKTFIEQIKKPISTDPNENDSFKKFIGTFANVIKQDELVTREENIKEATINFINNLKEQTDKPFIIQEEPIVKKEEQKKYLPSTINKNAKKQKPIVKEEQTTTPVKEENKYVKELKTRDKIDKKNINKSKNVSNIESIVKKQVAEILSRYPNLGFTGGGGGTNAVQYAKGGTMNGDLNVTGRYLSGGTNLTDIFLTTETDSQTLYFTESSLDLSITKGNTITLSALSGQKFNQLLNTTDNVTFNQTNANIYLSSGVNLFDVFTSTGSGISLPTVINYFANNSTTLSTVTLNPIAVLSGTNLITSRSLQNKLGEIISVKDFGAKGDGLTNDWLAIQKTLSAAAGIAKVYIPGGLYFINQELKIPSNSYIYGAGIGTTIIKLSSTANATQCVMTNSQNTRSVSTNLGNENIVIKDLELDGNVSRFPGSYSPVGDTSGTGLCFAYVKNALVERVSVHDTCRHCFDICAPETSITFNPLDYVANPSFNIHLKDIIAYGAGDDNITTHFSHSIIIENAYVPYTGGTEVPTNSNGIEVDDGSYDITIIGGYIKNCRRGLEIKGHSWAPAAKRVKVYGLTVENCVRNFGIRHLGFDSTDSKTAFDVALYDCTSIAPLSSTFTTDAPRSLQVSNYDGVFVKDFKVVGEHNASRAVTIQERARNVNFDGVTFTQISGGITGITDAMLYIDSTASRNITVRNAIFRDCIGLPIAAIGSVPGVIIDGVDARTSLSANPPARVIDFSWSPLDTPYIIRNVTMSGYTSAYQLGGSHDFDYPTTIDVGRITNIIPSSPATANTQYTVARFGWREGTGQGLNTGLGTRIEFTGNLVSGISANNDIPVAYIATRKLNGTDSDVTSTLTFGTLSANGATAVDRMSITPAGNIGINTSLPNERLTVSGNISAIGIIYTNNDIEITDFTKGIIHRSPNGNRWRTTITDSGILSSVLI